MKLELKHLAPYLPYGLKVQYEGIINGKELYVENIGYLWVIWDFGFATSSAKYNTREYTADFSRILRAFMNKNIKGWLPDEFPHLPSTIELVGKILRLINYYRVNHPNIANADVVFFDMFINTCNLFIRREDLPDDAIIINKGNPYRIEK
jgi:hypothetical protein